MVANMARPPRGGDTDQIKGVAAGECGVALTNSYYWLRLVRSSDPKDKESSPRSGFVWPNQATTGTHINISGGGVAKNAPNKANAVLFLEYLSSPPAQTYFADGNNEWPVVKGASRTMRPWPRSAHRSSRDVPIATIGKNQIAAQRILDASATADHRRAAHVHLHLQCDNGSADPLGCRSRRVIAERGLDAARGRRRVRLLPRGRAAGDP